MFGMDQFGLECSINYNHCTVMGIIIGFTKCSCQSGYSYRKVCCYFCQLKIDIPQYFAYKY